jgi:polynucleotide 5'-kinase involved in rRNA processing
LEASELIRPRDRQTRQAHRAAQFAQYFAESRIFDIDWLQPAVWPEPRFQRHGLISLEDERGYVLALGLVLEMERAGHRIRVLSPLTSLRDVTALRLGDLLLNPLTYREEHPA